MKKLNNVNNKHLIGRPTTGHLLALVATMILGLAAGCGLSPEEELALGQNELALSTPTAGGLVYAVVAGPDKELPPVVEARNIQQCVNQWRSCRHSCDRVFERGYARSEWCREGCTTAARMCANESSAVD